MSMILLSDAERAQLKLQHRHERDGRIRDRIKAVLLFDKGWSIPAIAEALLLSEDAIRDHIAEYRESKKLKPENGGSTQKLSIEHSALLVAHLRNHTYLYVKDIVAYVKSTWSVTYSVPGMRNWLQRYGFSYKKPALVPGKADEQQQRDWMAEYEKLKQNLPADETICFMDGVHPTHNVQPAYGWIEKGVRKEVPANSGRSRINLSGVLDVIDHKVLIQEDKMLNAEATISFFRKIEAAYPGKKRVHIFCDNAGYYRNKAVTEYLEMSKIKLHFLPPYSPNLNPIERLWKWMKERVIYNTYYPDFEDFKMAVFGFFATISALAADSILGQDFRSRVRDKFRPVGA
ncbi:MAG: IS630 family transposase [Flavobacteriia bacterium]|nr:IS630 family transposase [Flavobacteriia bacterium]